MMDILNIDPEHILLFAVLAVAIVSDLRWRKIPNWLTGSAIVAGILFHTVINQIAGLIFSVEGAGLGLGLFLLLYLFGWMGAGDVKLCAAVGSFLGPAHTLMAVLLTMLAGGAVALVALAYRLGWREVGCWLRDSITAVIITRSVPQLTSIQGATPKVPYAVAIGIGTLITLVSVK